MVTATNSTDAMVEHVFALIDALQEGCDSFFCYVNSVHHLWPILTCFVYGILKVLVQFLVVIYRLLMNGHTELYILSDSLLDGWIINFIDLKVCDGCAYRATDVTTNMIWVHMVCEWHGEANHDVLASVNVRHDSYL